MYFTNDGMATAASIPRIATTIISSMSVKPDRKLRRIGFIATVLRCAATPLPMIGGGQRNVRRIVASAREPERHVRGVRHEATRAVCARRHGLSLCQYARCPTQFPGGS